MDEPKHTPTPWYQPKYAPWQILPHYSTPGDTVIAETHPDPFKRTKEESYADAEFIVRAVNQYDAHKELTYYARKAWAARGDLLANGGDPFCPLGQALLGLHIAIEKAEGRQS